MEPLSVRSVRENCLVAISGVWQLGVFWPVFSSGILDELFPLGTVTRLTYWSEMLSK